MQLTKYQKDFVFVQFLYGIWTQFKHDLVIIIFSYYFYIVKQIIT